MEKSLEKLPQRTSGMVLGSFATLALLLALALAPDEQGSVGERQVCHVRGGQVHDAAALA